MNKKTFYIFGFIAILILFLGGVVFGSNKYLTSKNKPEDNCSNSKNSTKYNIEIKDDKVLPEITNGKLCDTMTITNLDDKDREIAFGEHDKHTEYDGVEEKELSKDQSLTITFNKVGSYIFHDHNQDEVQGSFVVK